MKSKEVIFLAVLVNCSETDIILEPRKTTL